MKRLKYLSILLILIAISCKGQSKQKENYLQFDVWKHINSRYLGLFTSSWEHEGQNYEMAIPYYDFTTQEIEIGDACLFTISKTYPEDWVKEASKGECEENSSSEEALFCQAKKLFSSDTSLLKKELDLYLFFINKKELEGPFIEEAEGGEVHNYYPMKGSTVVIYRYEDGKWKEIDRVKQEGDEIPRSFGMDYMEQLASKKVKKYLENN